MPISLDATIMRILFLTTEAFGGRGGIAQYNRDFLKAACSYKYCEEVVAIPRLVSSLLEALPHNLTYHVSSANSKFKFARAVLNQVFLDRTFNLIICGHINLLPLAYLASQWLRVPLILLIYGIEVWKPTPSRVCNLLAKSVDAIISISKYTIDNFSKWSVAPQASRYIVPNAIDLKRYSFGPKKPELLTKYGLEGKTILVTLGRLSAEERYKGIDEVMAILPKLSLERSDIAYLIIGDGTDRPRLEAKAKSLGVSSRVAFSGYVSENEKLDHYRLADAFVMPGHGEGFGFVFLEAMAAGIPVVASKLDGSREAVREGLLGVMVDPRNEESLKSGILKALEQSRGIIPKGIDYFAYDKFEVRVHNVLSEITNSYIGPRQ